MSMTDVHRQILKQCRVEFVKDLNPDDVSDHLVANAILTPDDEEELMSKPARKEKVRYLLDLLPSRGDKAFNVLMKSLEDRDSGYYHLYELVNSKCQALQYPIKEECSAARHDISQNTPRSPNTIVTEQQLGKLAGNLGSEWERLGKDLGMSSSDMYSFKEENKYNIWAQKNTMLVKWRQRKYNNATIGELVKKCQENGVSQFDIDFLMKI